MDIRDGDILRNSKQLNDTERKLKHLHCLHELCVTAATAAVIVDHVGKRAKQVSFLLLWDGCSYFMKSEVKISTDQYTLYWLFSDMNRVGKIYQSHAL